MAYVKHFTAVISEEHFAFCPTCESGVGIREVFPDGRVKEYGIESEATIGHPCERCGTTIVLDVWNNTREDGGYFEKECDCGKKFHIHHDGQECPKCNQMFNAVGQKIDHLGYDSFGDTEEW